MSDGAERYHRNRARGIEDRAIALPLPAAENDRAAKGAEDYFADIYGLPHADNDGPENAEFVCGTASIDVKWTPRLNGRLLHSMTSRTRATYYVLVVGTYAVAGWAWGYELHRSVRDLGHGRTYCLDQEDLHENVDMMMATLGYVDTSA